jgi:hypothetical protein
MEAYNQKTAKAWTCCPLRMNPLGKNTKQPQAGQLLYMVANELHGFF